MVLSSTRQNYEVKNKVGNLIHKICAEAANDRAETTPSENLAGYGELGK